MKRLRVWMALPRSPGLKWLRLLAQLQMAARPQGLAQNSQPKTIREQRGKVVLLTSSANYIITYKDLLKFSGYFLPKNLWDVDKGLLFG
jgi:hypothetical protein